MVYTAPASSGIPEKQVLNQESAGFNVNITPVPNLTVTSGTSPAKGTWVQLIASTTKKAYAMQLFFGKGPSFDRYGYDIGVGAAGSEVVVVADYLYDYANDNTPQLALPEPTFIPIVIPAGSRVAIRCNSPTSAGNFKVAAYFLEV